MGLRPSRCYKWDRPAYTRVSKNPSTSFVTGIPGSKINIYDMGTPSTEFNTEVSLVSQTDIQIRHNALEAVRITINKALGNALGVKNYHFKVRTYPHHIMRENAMATGAGADRVQDGMRKAFGKPIGRAARVKKGQIVLSVYVSDENDTIKIVRGAIRKGVMKLPGKMKTITNTI